jgi:hypothetical protein
VKKITLNEKCSAAEVCNDIVGLKCSQDGVCKCADNAHWKDDKCGEFIILVIVLRIFYFNIVLNSSRKRSCAKVRKERRMRRH